MPDKPVDVGGVGADRLVVDFVSRLRREGVAVPLGATVEYGRALGALGSGRPRALYWAGRATLVRRPEDVPAYDRAFAAFFGAATATVVAARAVPVELHVDAPDDDQASPGDDDYRPPGEVRPVRWSAIEVLRRKDLAECTPDELDEAHRLMADLRVHAALRRSRRRRPTRRQRGHPDLRRTVSRALRTGGEVVRPAATERGSRPRRLVILLDVSGSMEPYARGLARFAHAAVASRRRGQVEVFALGTRVTRISHELATHDPDAALRRAATVVADWAGGTRLGDGLRTFNDRWGVRGAARGAVVVVLSDGWDRGDPAVLGSELARLRRVAHRLVWVNPLKASPGYAPLAQGMAAALPHIDEFVEGHSIASLEELAEVVAR
ncbi:MAG: vWA domain-containing protein [Acidimicrobiales bacterium]